MHDTESLKHLKLQISMSKTTFNMAGTRLLGAHAQ